MSEVVEIVARWVPLARAAEQWALPKVRLETLIALGVVVVGKDPTGGLYLDQVSLEKGIEAIPPRQAVALLSAVGVQENDHLRVAAYTLTSAAAQVGLAAKTVRRAIQTGQLIATRTGSGPRASYSIDPHELQVWVQTKNPNFNEAFIRLEAERKKHQP